MLLHKAAINQIISNCACFPQRQETWHASKNLKSQAVHLKNWCFQQYTFKNYTFKIHFQINLRLPRRQEMWHGPQKSQITHLKYAFKNYTCVSLKTWTPGSEKFQILCRTSSKVFLQLPDQRRNISGAGGLKSDVLTTFFSLFINISGKDLYI